MFSIFNYNIRFISTIYVLVYILKLKLPWQQIYSYSLEERARQIYQHKYSIPPIILCQDTPDIFTTLLVYCYNLSYTETPNYEYIRFLFDTCK